MSQLPFDEGMAAQMEVIYRRRDILRRRAIVRDALGAQPGEAIVDVGCGPGFYMLELLEQVGPGGRVVGVDASASGRHSPRSVRAPRPAWSRWSQRPALRPPKTAPAYPPDSERPYWRS